MTINSRITLAIKKFFKKFGKIIFIVLFIMANSIFYKSISIKKARRINSN